MRGEGGTQQGREWRRRGGEPLSVLLKQEEQTLTRQETAGLAWGKQLDWGPGMKGTGGWGADVHSQAGCPEVARIGSEAHRGSPGMCRAVMRTCTGVCRGVCPS